MVNVIVDNNFKLLIKNYAFAEEAAYDSTVFVLCNLQTKSCSLTSDIA